MAFPLPDYAKIKDKYCICYTGNNIEYIVQLLYLRPHIEEELPGIQIYIGYPSRHEHLVEGHARVVRAEDIDPKKREYAYIRQIRCDQISHPVENLLEESRLTLPTLETPTLVQTEIKRCAIYPKGGLPTKWLTQQQTDNLFHLCRGKGYQPVLEGDLETVGWVIGVENAPLFQAACKGIKTSLVPTGVGTRLYQRLFPTGEILKLAL